MKQIIIGTVCEVRPSLTAKGNAVCDLLLELPNFGKSEPEFLEVSTSGQTAEQAKRLAVGSRVVADVKCVSKSYERNGTTGWSTRPYAFRVEPIGTAEAYTQNRAATSGYGGRGHSAYGGDDF